MRKNFFILMMASLIYTVAFSQKDTLKYSLDNNINGSFTKYSDNSFIANAGIFGDNSISYKFLKIGSSTNYTMSFKGAITSNEFLEKLNIGFGDFFLSDVYSRSMARSIRNDNSIGVGYGKKFFIKSISVSFSYAVLYQKTYYANGIVSNLARNSLRTKIKYVGEKIGFSTEIYYQPSFVDANDYIVYGNAKLIIFPDGKINFIVQDVLNYISKSNIRTLHNVTFGIGFSIKN